MLLLGWKLEGGSGTRLRWPARAAGAAPLAVGGFGGGVLLEVPVALRSGFVAALAVLKVTLEVAGRPVSLRAETSLACLCSLRSRLSLPPFALTYTSRCGSLLSALVEVEDSV